MRYLVYDIYGIHNIHNNLHNIHEIHNNGLAAAEGGRQPVVYGRGRRRRPRHVYYKKDPMYIIFYNVIHEELVDYCKYMYVMMLI